MKKNQKLLKRLDDIYGELKKAERQIKHQAKEMDIGKQRMLNQTITRAKGTIKSLFWQYIFCVEYKEDKNENHS